MATDPNAIFTGSSYAARIRAVLRASEAIADPAQREEIGLRDLHDLLLDIRSDLVAKKRNLEDVVRAVDLEGDTREHESDEYDFASKAFQLALEREEATRDRVRNELDTLGSQEHVRVAMQRGATGMTEAEAQE